MTLLVADALLTPEREVRPGALRVDDGGLVSAVGEGSGERASGVLLPGFVDVQLNGAAGVTLAESTDEAFDRVGAALLRSGTTSYCPTLPTDLPDTYPRFLDAAARARTRPGPRIVGVHLEGPFLNPVRKGAHREELLRAPDPSWLEKLLDRQPGLVRVVTLAPELPGAMDVIALCADRGVTVSVGHSDATAEEADKAYDAGAVMLTHLFNGMRPIHHRDPGVAAAAIARHEVRCGVICDGRHVDPTVATVFVRALGPRRAAVVSDAVAHPSEGPLLTGGFVLLDGALRNLVSWGFSLADAATMVSLTPARAVGAQEGSLEPGSHADAVLWWDGAVAAVFMDGEQVA
jgi:N-acetylglucosamine-6-phosphate deacetylase